MHCVVLLIGDGFAMLGWIWTDRTLHNSMTFFVISTCVLLLASYAEICDEGWLRMPNECIMEAYCGVWRCMRALGRVTDAYEYIRMHMDAH